jgi:O-antigen ligase
MISQWLGTGPAMNSPDEYLNGSPLDAATLTCLLLAAVGVLATRRARVMALLRANQWVVAFFLYCLISVLWSDFPLVALKRWTKFSGNLVMVLVVLTDPNPAGALKRFLARMSFLLISLSVLLVKYYPALSRGYNRYTWTSFYTGVSTDKNGLGAICLIFGLASVWQFLEAFRGKRSSARTKSLVAHACLLSMNVYLLRLANSSTSVACFLLGTLLLLIIGASGKTTPRTVHLLVGAVTSLALLFYFSEDAWASMVHGLGRETNLTGRTDIWNDVLALHFNPILGTGFESFWLGSRAEYFWNKYPFHPNQAHNGYLEVYLNLGLIGAVLLASIILAGYGKVVNAFKARLRSAPIKLCFVIIPVIYNMTEATFKVMHPAFIAFLLGALVTSRQFSHPEIPRS